MALLATLRGAPVKRAALALLVLAWAPPAGAADLREDPCFRDRELRVGAAPGRPFYSTVAPFEHFGSDRNQVFPHTCTLAELGGPGPVAVRQRQSPVSFQTPYIAATRGREELFVYGYGSDAAAEGGFVAAVDPRTLAERWRTRIPDTTPRGQWSWPGVMAVHGNGFLYAVYGSVLVKLDPADGRVLARRELPEDPAQSGAVYNGLLVMPDGRIVTKKLERGPCPTQLTPEGPVSPVEALGGLLCSNLNALPSLFVVVDPDDLAIVSTLVPPEPVTGRITAGDGFLFAAGRDNLRRFRYADGRLELDTGWGPVPYRAGDEQPGTGPGVLGDFLVVQTNFLPATAPMTLTAVSLRDERKVFRVRPFPGSPASFIVSKAALDPDNGMVVTHDTAAGRMAAYRLDPDRGFVLRWRRTLTSLNFSALVGPPEDREVVISDLAGASEQVVWLDLETGRERARTGTLANVPAPGNIVTPGFGGRFYYVSARGVLWELRPETAGRDADPPQLAVRRLRRGLRIRLSEPATVEVRRGRRRLLRRRLPAGTSTVRLRSRARVRISARDAAGNPSPARRAV